MDVSDVISVLQFVCRAAGGLAGAAALIIYGTNKLNPQSQSGMADALMIGCIIAAIVFFAASVYVGGLTLTYGS